MTFRLPFQIPRAVYSLKQARSPDRLARNVCQFDGFKLKNSVINGEQITALQNTKLLADCKKCFKISVQEQLSYLSFTKKNKPFSAKSKIRKCLKYPKSTLERNTNDKKLYLNANCNVVGKTLVCDDFLGTKSPNFNQKSNFYSVKREPPAGELIEIQHRQRKKFDCDDENPFDEEKEQKLFFRDASRPHCDDCISGKIYTGPSTFPKLRRPIKSYDDKKMLYSHNVGPEPALCPRADDVAGYKCLPKKLSRLPDDCVPCDKKDRLVEWAPEIKRPQKNYDDTKLLYDHSQGHVCEKPKRADDVVGYKNKQEALSTIPISLECQECDRIDRLVTYMPKLKRLRKSYDDSKLPFAHPKCPILHWWEQIERQDDVKGHKKQRKKLSKLPISNECVPCDKLDPLVTYMPKIKRLKKNYDDTKLPFSHPKCPIPHWWEEIERQDDVTGHGKEKKKLAKIPLSNECQPCDKLDPLVTYMPKIKRLRKSYDDSKLPFSHPRCPIPHWWEEIERQDDVMGHKIEKKKLSKIPISNECVPCDKLDPLVTYMPKIKRLKKSYDDSQLPFSHPRCPIPHWWEEVERQDDVTGQRIEKKKLSKIPVSNECVPCDKLDPLVTYMPKIKRLRKSYDDSKLPFSHPRCPIPHWWEEVPRQDDVAGHQKAKKKLSKIQLSNECVPCDKLDPLVTYMPKIKRLKKSYDDSKLPFSHPRCPVPQWWKTTKRFDEINNYKISPKKLKKLPLLHDCTPCDRYGPCRGMVLPKLKRLKPRKYFKEQQCQDRHPNPCNVMPPRMDDIMCWKPKKRKLPSFRTKHTLKYCTYAPGIPSKVGDLLALKSLQRLPSFNTLQTNNYSTFATNRRELKSVLMENVFKNDYDNDASSFIKNLNLQIDNEIEELEPYLTKCHNGFLEDVAKIKPPLPAWGYLGPIKGSEKIDKEIHNIEFRTPSTRLYDVNKTRAVIQNIISPFDGWGYFPTITTCMEPNKYTKEEPDTNLNQQFRKYSTQTCYAEDYVCPPKVLAPYLSYGDYKSKDVTDPTECPDLFLRLLQPTYQFHDPLNIVKPPPPAWGHIDPLLEENCKIGYRSQGPLYDGPWVEQEEMRNLCTKVCHGCKHPQPPPPPVEKCTKILPPYPSFSDMKPQFPELRKDECWYARMMNKKQKVELNLDKARRFFEKLLKPGIKSKSGIHTKIKDCPDGNRHISKKPRKRHSKNEYIYETSAEQDTHQKYRAAYSIEEEECKRKKSATTSSIHTSLPAFRSSRCNLKPKPYKSTDCCDDTGKRSSKEEIKSKILQGYFKCRENVNDFQKDLNDCKEFNAHLAKKRGFTVRKTKVIKVTRRTKRKVKKIPPQCPNKDIKKALKSSHITTDPIVRKTLDKYSKPIQEKCAILAQEKSKLKECCDKAKAVSISKKTSKRFESKPSCPERKTKAYHAFHKGIDSKKYVRKSKSAPLLLKKGKSTTKQKKSAKEKCDISKSAKNKCEISEEKKYETCPKKCPVRTKPSIISKLIAYFRARPNCPSPNDWKKKILREKAVRAARAAGLEICDKNEKFCGRVKKPEGLPETKAKKFSTCSYKHFNQPKTEDHNVRKYSTNHINNQTELVNGDYKLEELYLMLAKKYAEKYRHLINLDRKLSTLVHASSNNDNINIKTNAKKYNTASCIPKPTQNYNIPPRTKPFIPIRKLSTFVNNDSSKQKVLPSNMSSNNMSQLEALANKNKYVGRMYQVKLSKIGVKNGLLRRNVDEEPYTFCQICKFVPRTSNVTLQKKEEKRKCN